MTLLEQLPAVAPADEQLQPEFQLHLASPELTPFASPPDLGRLGLPLERSPTAPAYEAHDAQSADKFIAFVAESYGIEMSDGVIGFALATGARWRWLKSLFAWLEGHEAQAVTQRAATGNMAIVNSVARGFTNYINKLAVGKQIEAEQAIRLLALTRKYVALAHAQRIDDHTARVGSKLYAKFQDELTALQRAKTLIREPMQTLFAEVKTLDAEVTQHLRAMRYFATRNVPPK